MNAETTGREPWAIANMEELLAIARAMEQEAIRGYIALEERMRSQNRPDLVKVFEVLRLEEQGHLQNVDNWIAGSDRSEVPAVELAQPLFDDEGAALVAPELLDSYRAFSMAVRNEERAFVFWTYVAAHAQSDEVQQAAERMAREELGHVATLRRERRRAFHDLRRLHEARAPVDIAALELRLAALLEKKAAGAALDYATRFNRLAEEARGRSALATAGPVDGTASLNSSPEEIEDRLVPLCEFLLDCYLALAERQRDESAQRQSQEAAGAVLTCLHVIRAEI